MEMVSSAISDLPRFVRWRDTLPDVNGGFGRLSLSRYGSSDLASPDRFWIFSLGCREEDYPRSFCLGCYILDNGDSYSRLSIDIDKASRLLFPDILVLVLLLMFILNIQCSLFKEKGKVFYFTASSHYMR